MAFPKQIPAIVDLRSFDLNSVLTRQTPVKIAYKLGLDYLNHQRFARKITKFSVTVGGGVAAWPPHPPAGTPMISGKQASQVSRAARVGKTNLR